MVMPDPPPTLERAAAAPAAPRRPDNPPGLSAISYRIGDFNGFRRAMLDMVSRPDLLAGLFAGDSKARGAQPAPLLNPFAGWHPDIAGDYHTMLLELWAYLADVLTFYQERIANEAYLPTATQDDSLYRLADLIGYRPRPVVAATTALALTVAPDKDVHLPGSLRVSAPAAPGQPAAVFELGAPVSVSGGASVVTPLTTLTRNQFAPLRDYVALDGLLISPLRLSQFPAGVDVVRQAAAAVYGNAADAYLRAIGIDYILATVDDPSDLTMQVTIQGAYRAGFATHDTDAPIPATPSSVAQEIVDVARTMPDLAPGAAMAVLKQDGATPTLELRTIASIAVAAGATRASLDIADKAPRQVVLEGINTRMALGDHVLIVENAGVREQEKATLQQIMAIGVDPKAATTTITWQEDLKDTYGATAIALHALHVRARPFGSHAPLWGSLPAALTGVAPTFPNAAVGGLPPAALAAASLAPANAPYADKDWDDTGNAWAYLPTPGDAMDAVYLDGLYAAVQGTPDKPGWAVLEANRAPWILREWTPLEGSKVAGISREMSWTGDFAGIGGTQLLFYAAGSWYFGTCNGQTISARALTQDGSAPVDLSRQMIWAGNIRPARPPGAPRAELLLFSTVDRRWWLGTVAADTYVLTWTQLTPSTNFGGGDTGQPMLAWAGAFLTRDHLAVLFYKTGVDQWWLARVETGGAGRSNLDLSRLPSGVAKAAGLVRWQGAFSGADHDELLVYDAAGTWRLGTCAQSDTGELSLSWATVRSTLPIAGGRRPIAGAFAPGSQDGQVRDALFFYSAADRVWQLGTLTQAGADGLAFRWVPAGQMADIADKVRAENLRGNFSGAGRCELLSYSDHDQRWRLARITDGQLSWSLAGDSTVIGPLGDAPLFWAGAFVTPTHDDILVYNAVDGTWWLGGLRQADPYQVFHIVDAQPATKAAYLLNARVTRLQFRAGENVQSATGRFALRDTVIHVVTEPLELRNSQPLPARPVEGGALLLSGAHRDLRAGQHIIVRGSLIAPPTGQPETGVEQATVAGAPIVEVLDGVSMTTVPLATPLTNRYAPDGLQVDTHVVMATQGQTVRDEGLGSGTGAAFQSYPLKRGPLIYVLVSGPDGTSRPQSTLTVTVNGVQWTERPSLWESTPDALHFVTTTDAAGLTTVHFGDGVRGARPPSGRDNIRATYRTGLGASGNLPAGAITQLIDSVPGLQGIRSPLAPADGTDRESGDEVRRKAPASSLWFFCSAVTPADYAALALSCEGVAKATARWIWREAEAPGAAGRPSILLTVAGTSGDPLSSGLGRQLRAFMDAQRDPNVELRLRDVTPVYLDVEAIIDVEPLASRRDTLAAAVAALNPGTNPDGTAGFFSFSRLQIGQGISLGAVYAVLQSVNGVRDAVVTRLCPPQTPVDAPQAVGDIAIADGELVVIKNDPADTANHFGKLHIVLGQGGIADA